MSKLFSQIDKEFDDFNTKYEIIKQEFKIPWVEKFRPKVFEEIVANKNLIETLNKYIETKYFPHLIFYGPPGTGKTTVINACAKKLYGERAPRMVLQINASEERGIETVRNKIKEFVLTKITQDEDNFKMVILDEADSMTLSAQSMLRRIIEDYTKNARFCLICNKVKNIDPAIQSRCTSFRFAQLDSKSIKSKLKTICSELKIKYDEKGLDFLIMISSGDMRKVLNNLQSVYMTYKNITYENVGNCLAFPIEHDINFILETVNKKSLKESNDLIKQIIMEKQYSLLEITNELHKILLSQYMDKKIEQTKFCNIILKLKKLEQYLFLCPTEEISITALISCFY